MHHIQMGGCAWECSTHPDHRQTEGQPQTTLDARGVQLTRGPCDTGKDMLGAVTPKRARGKEVCQTYSAGKDIHLHDQLEMPLFRSVSASLPAEKKTCGHMHHSEQD